jgi:glycosyltransferase involved in cell wall biosynthesis
MSLTIILASILKPANDVRLYSKIGQSLAKAYPQDQFHFIGFRPKQTPLNIAHNVHLHPLYHFKRLSWRRIGAGIRFFRKLWRLKPDIVVVATFELLFPAFVYSWFRKVKLVYDVQENYARNVRYTQVFPWVLRLPLTLGIRGIERLAHWRITHYLLAEACYAQEMPFLQGKSTIIANKINLWAEDAPLSRTKGLLVYSGTVSGAYGVFRAIDWAAKLHQQQPHICLLIVGHCPQTHDWQRLQQLAEKHDFIRLEISQTPVPHEKIIHWLQQAQFALLPYQINRSVKNRIPTKFYECVALQTPMLIQHNEAWTDFVTQYKAGTLLDFDDLAQANQQWETVNPQRFYQGITNVSGVYWADEAIKLLDVWKQIRE